MHSSIKYSSLVFKWNADFHVFNINKPVLRSASPFSVVGSVVRFSSFVDDEGLPLSVAVGSVVGSTSSVYNIEVTKPLSFCLACAYFVKAWLSSCAS